MPQKFQNLIQQIRTEHITEVINSKEALLYAYHTEYELHLFESYFNHRDNDINLNRTIRYLDFFYAVNKLELSSHLYTQSKVTAIDRHEIIPVEAIIRHLEETEVSVIPLALSLKLAYQMLTHPDDGDAYFNQLREVLHANQGQFSNFYCSMLASYLRNFCTAQYNHGRSEYLHFLFDLYRDHLEQGYLLENGGIKPSTLYNIVRTGIKLQAFDWVEKLLVDRPYVIEGASNPEAVYNFFLAQYYFAIGRFAEADALLNHDMTATFNQLLKDQRLVLEAQQLELKIYFETLQEEDLLRDKLRAYRTKISRKSENEIPPHLAEAILNFLKTLLRLINIRAIAHIGGPTRTELTKLTNQLPHPIVEREWLQDKIKQLSSISS
jgi:hypothetical protein